MKRENLGNFYSFPVSVLILTVCQLCSEARQPYPWPSEQTKESIELAHQELREVTDNHISHFLKGGMLFDGRVQKCLKHSMKGDSFWNVRVEHFYRNMKSEFKKRRAPADGDTLVIGSPPLSEGGCKLEIGERYRIYAISLDNRFDRRNSKFYVFKLCVLPLGQ